MSKPPALPVRHNWLRDRLNYLMHSTEGLTEKKPIHQSTEFDEGDINFKKAQQELKNIEYHAATRRAFDRDCVQSGDMSLPNDVNWCKKLVASMAAIDKKLQEKYGAQPRKTLSVKKLLPVGNQHNINTKIGISSDTTAFKPSSALFRLLTIDR